MTEAQREENEEFEVNAEDISRAASVLALMPPTDAAFGESDYLGSEPLTELALELVKRYEEFDFFADEEYSFTVLWKREGGKRAGKATLGKCNAPSGLMKHFAVHDWVIWLAADHARTYGLNVTQVEALLFHELKHCALKPGKDDEPPAPSTVGHDIEAFFGEVERYGLWRNDLKEAAAVFGKQLRLDEAES